jgi:glycosyltransferase involved in cell wall biosynthesis
MLDTANIEPQVTRAASDGRPLRVAVLIDLPWRAEAGGHVKCWERYAEAAAAHGDALDLTIHIQGRPARVIEIAPNVRMRLHRPVFSTRNFSFLNSVADHTDLAPFHPGLYAALRDADVVHTTDAYFAYARTAERSARKRGQALVTSLHTDTPKYTRHYSAMVLRRLIGRGLTAWLRLPDRLGASKNRRLHRHIAACARYLLSERDDLNPELAGDTRASVLRRGIEKDLFHPKKRDRARLAAEYGIAPDRFVLAFAGRIESGKRVMVLARAARMLLDRGAPLHVVIAGDGEQRGAVQALLGEHVTILGTVDHERLAWIEASADLFVFPGHMEIVPNVVLEAMASGLVPVVHPSSGAYVRDGKDGVVIASADPADWAAAIETLRVDETRRRGFARTARAYVERERPSWDEALMEDLLPVWRDAAAAVGRR